LDFDILDFDILDFNKIMYIDPISCKWLEKAEEQTEAAPK
jgi:hypothetical protein